MEVLENGRIAGHIATHEKDRVTIETVTTHQIYVEQAGERFLYALTTDLGEAIKLKQKAKHEFGIGRPPKTNNDTDTPER